MMGDPFKNGVEDILDPSAVTVLETAFPNLAPAEEGRCEECGSWDRECGSDVPVPDCACARCSRAALAELRERHDAFVKQVASSAAYENVLALKREHEELKEKVKQARRVLVSSWWPEEVVSKVRAILGEK